MKKLIDVRSFLVSIIIVLLFLIQSCSIDPVTTEGYEAQIPNDNVRSFSYIPLSGEGSNRYNSLNHSILRQLVEARKKQRSTSVIYPICIHDPEQKLDDIKKKRILQDAEYSMNLWNQALLDLCCHPGNLTTLQSFPI